MAYFKMLLFAIYVISNLVLFLGHHLCDVCTTLEHCKYTIFLIYIYYRNVLSIHIRYAILWRQTWQKYCRYAIIGFDSQWKNTAEVWIPYSRAWGRSRFWGAHARTRALVESTWRSAPPSSPTPVLVRGVRKLTRQTIGTHNHLMRLIGVI